MDQNIEQRLKNIERRLQVHDDQQAILKLKALYVNLNDGGWAEQGGTHANPDAVADLFVEDGVWDGRPIAGFAEGRKAIRAMWQDMHLMPFIIHYITNPIIDVKGDNATGHWHALVTATFPDSAAHWILGYYKETYVRTADGWKFKTLRFEGAAKTRYEQGWGKQQFA